ncbi:MAG: carbonic anhydrase, partial [Ilumatobacter sp.]
CLSQRLLDSREILLIHHTQCGLQGLDEDEFTAELERELGVRPSWPVESFSDARADVAQSMMRLEASPFVQHCDHIRGFVYDVGTGLLDEVART